MTTLITGNKCRLVKRKLDDFEWFFYWQSHGEWRKTDAPWEALLPTDKDTFYQEYHQDILAETDDCVFRAWIVVDDIKVGSVNAYGRSSHDHSIKIGIGIYASDYLGLGIGHEALTLWMTYLFKQKNFHRIELDTYSFNQKMIRTANRLGLTQEGVQREVRFWNGEWANKINFAILRSEFEG